MIEMMAPVDEYSLQPRHSRVCQKALRLEEFMFGTFPALNGSSWKEEKQRLSIIGRLAKYNSLTSRRACANLMGSKVSKHCIQHCRRRLVPDTQEYRRPCLADTLTEGARSL